MSSSSAEAPSHKISSNSTMITLASLNESSSSSSLDNTSRHIGKVMTNNGSNSSSEQQKVAENEEEKDRPQPLHPPTVAGAGADTAWTAALYKSDWNAKGAKFLAEGR
ncbi:hypothetical protein CERZMDRAFT_82505 [Cercospora zeae-maydis SCOH1-5]|uniref:Uncharacterized protein n=1 Tax=Cercospora zeae-maydis SCOH1-5 TaxID=717836 RepID=A0A6A6FQ99_9PEZI|nr:hypothetical protein CERZMDRAFT_82505 [Cercospora zeae-maydis SCOH1-5]